MRKFVFRFFYLVLLLIVLEVEVEGRCFINVMIVLDKYDGIEGVLSSLFYVK